MIKLLMFILVGLGLPASAWAVTATVSTSTASGVDSTDKANIVIFAGFAGAIGGCDASAVSTTSTCNSCTALNLCNGGSTLYYQCAERSIHRELLLTIELTLDTVPTTPSLKVFWKDSSQEITPRVAPNAADIRANTPFTIQLRWGDICTKAGFNDDCTYTTTTGTNISYGLSETLTIGLTDGGTSFTSGASQKFTVRLSYAQPDDNTVVIPAPVQPSASDQPFTDFKVLPGDGKVYVSDVWRGSVGPSQSGIKWSALRVYYAPFSATPPAAPAPDFCAIDYASSNYVDLLVENKTLVETSLADNTVSGLTNEQLYMFNIATVDESSLVTGFISPTAMSALTGAALERYYAQPGEVVGLLDDHKCFIATAAFGSPMEPHVELLREFRNQFLNSNSWGRQFVQFYYHYSPPVAKWISEHEGARILVRGLLWPVVLFADLSLKWGLFLTFGLFTLSLLSLILLGQRFRREI